MSRELRRYEVLLPRAFNDGSPVPVELVGKTVRELRERFGAVSTETQVIHGNWEHVGQIYQDELIRIFVDVPDVAENREFFVAFKETLKARFQQLDIWLTTHPIESI